MGKSHWDKWRGMDEFREQMDRLLDAARQGLPHCCLSGPGLLWMPLADVVETPQALIARIELPGVVQDQVLVEIVDGALVVRGERPVDREDAEASHHLMERAHGAFARRFPLPEGADGEGISAVLRHGLLVVVIPKHRAAAPPRRTLTLE